MSMFQKAERRQRKARIAIFGPSGSGKTFTALSIATGLGGKIALIDTERYSASLYAGQFEFDTCDLPSHTIESYTSAINDAAQAGYDVLIIDSLSHAWQELLAEVDRIKAQSRSGNSFQAWANATPKHKKLVQAILTYPGHIIGTMRSETAYAIETNERGKQVPVRLGLKPDQGKNIEFEFDMLIEMDVDNVGTFGKDRTGLFQGRRVEKPGKALGEEIAAWLESGASIWADADHYKRALRAKVGDKGKGWGKKHWVEFFDAAVRVFDSGKYTSFMSVPADRREAFVNSINIETEAM
jgi:hypothetical protein